MCSSASTRDSRRVCAAHGEGALHISKYELVTTVRVDHWECVLLISEYAGCTTSACLSWRGRIVHQRVRTSHHKLRVDHCECVLIFSEYARITTSVCVCVCVAHREGALLISEYAQVTTSAR